MQYFHTNFMELVDKKSSVDIIQNSHAVLCQPTYN